MTLNGYIENGHVVFDGPLNLPEGTKVTVVVNVTDPGENSVQVATLYERMKPIIGIATHLPPDASTKIDEVLYGRGDS
jgi:hypothetical protein